MGDVPPPSSSPNGQLAQEAFNSTFHGSTSDGTQPGFARGLSGSIFQPQHQPHFDPTHNAFSAQFDMTQPQSTSRGPQASYNMSAMASALPQPAFRPALNNSGQARYGVDGTSGVGSQMGPYVGQSHMNHVAGQQYYMAQNAHMPAYYSPQMPHSQQHTNLSPRHNMNFYPNQAMMNHAQQPMAAGYYYPHPSHYAAHTSAMAGNMTPNQYIPHDHRGHSPATYQGQPGIGAYGALEGGCQKQGFDIVRSSTYCCN